MNDQNVSKEMEAFRCLRLTIGVEATSTIRLPSYQGGTLRGAFGHALRRSSCVLPDQECKSCLLNSNCAYSYVFETPVFPGTERLSKYPFAPHPFVLNPLTGTQGIFQPGSLFAFGMTLIGRSIEYLPYFIHAFIRMGEFGIGQGRGAYRVKIVNTLDAHGEVTEEVYRDGSFKSPRFFLYWLHAMQYCTGWDADRTRLKLVTPLRMRYQDSLCDDPQFHIILRNLLRRLSSLIYFHCAKTLDFPFKELIELAEEVRLVHQQTRWHDWERYSGRQGEKMKMGGLLGEVTYEGDLAPFFPFLVLGSWVNVGKGTSFGLGNYTIVD